MEFLQKRYASQYRLRQIGRENFTRLRVADDSVFFLSNDGEKLKNLIGVLEIFGLVSGLKFNLPKVSSRYKC